MGSNVFFFIFPSMYHLKGHDALKLGKGNFGAKPQVNLPLNYQNNISLITYFSFHTIALKVNLNELD